MATWFSNLSPDTCGLLADVVVGVHFLYIACVVGGMLLIVAGIIMRWQWIRNFWFRAGHLLMITIVAVESICAYECPLTTWERNLRESANQEVSDASFIGRWMHQMIMYDDVSFDDSVFTVAYIGFAVLVLATFVIAPPRCPRGKRGACGANATPKLSENQREPSEKTTA